MNNMNQYIKNVVKRMYQIDVDTASKEQLEAIEEINVSDITMNSEVTTWNFSEFSNLKKIDCSYLFIKDLITTGCTELEYLRWEGVRGNDIHLDLSTNKKLKKVVGGQDGIVELDFSFNPLLEEVSMSLSQSLRWIELSHCNNLKRLTLFGVLIPFVDLTALHNLEYVNISYMNQYKNMADEYGDGYPRPILFVNEDFNESIIDDHTRQYSYYTYKLIKVSEGSKEQKILNEVKAMKEKILSIPVDRKGKYVAILHYALMDKLNNL